MLGFIKDNANRDEEALLTNILEQLQEKPQSDSESDSETRLSGERHTSTRLFSSTHTKANDFYQLDPKIEERIVNKVKKFLELNYYDQYKETFEINDKKERATAINSIKKDKTYHKLYNELTSLWKEYISHVDNLVYKVNPTSGKRYIDEMLDEKFGKELSEQERAYYAPLHHREFRTAYANIIMQKVVISMGDSLGDDRDDHANSFLTNILNSLVPASCPYYSLSPVDFLKAYKAYLVHENQEGKLNENELFTNLASFAKEKQLRLQYPMENSAFKELKKIHADFEKISPIFYDLYKRQENSDDNTISESMQKLQTNLELMDPSHRTIDWFYKQIIKIDDFLFAKEDGKTLNIDVLLASIYDQYDLKNDEDKKNLRHQLRRHYISDVTGNAMKEVINTKPADKNNQAFITWFHSISNFLADIPSRYANQIGSVTNDQHQKFALAILSLVEGFEATFDNQALYLASHAFEEDPNDRCENVIKRLTQAFIDYIYEENDGGRFRIHSAYQSYRGIWKGWYEFEHHNTEAFNHFENELIHAFAQKLVKHPSNLLLTEAQEGFKLINLREENLPNIVKDIEKYAKEYKAEKFSAQKNKNERELEEIIHQLDKSYKEALNVPEVKKINDEYFVMDQFKARATHYAEAFYSKGQPRSTKEKKSLTEAIRNTLSQEAQEASIILKDNVKVAHKFVAVIKTIEAKLEKFFNLLFGKAHESNFVMFHGKQDEKQRLAEPAESNTETAQNNNTKEKHYLPMPTPP